MMNVAQACFRETGQVGRASRLLGHRRFLRLGIYGLLALGDMAGVGLAFMLAGLFVGGRGGWSPDLWAMQAILTILPLFFAVAIQRKPYSARFLMDARRTVSDKMTALVTAAALGTLILLRSDHHAFRLCVAVALGTMAGCGWFMLWRRIAERIAHGLFHGQPIAATVIVDDVPFEPLPGMMTLFAGASGLRPDRNDPVALDALAHAIAGMERVIIACSPARRAAWLDVMKGANVQGEFLLPELDRIGMLRTARLGANSTAIVTVGPLDTTSRMLKRLLDLSVALGALILLSPVLLMTALAVRLDSPGPVIFRQPRVGRGNRLFNVYKFRSMHVALCDVAGAQSTGRADTRITRVGRIIRKTSIDELPQLFNVLEGTMSIVGPRPHAVASQAAGQMFWELDDNYWHRHAIKPGITGLAQVKGLRGATEKATDLTGRVALDTAYMRDWSIWRDIGIILRTVMVLFHHNAY